MRLRVLAVLLLGPAGVVHADPGRELIVALRPPTTPVTKVSPAWTIPTGPAVPPLAARQGLRLVAGLDTRGASSHLGDWSIWLLSVADSVAVDSVMATVARDPSVAWVERHAVREPAVWWLDKAGPAAAGDTAMFPNDPLFRDGRQWGLENRGAPIAGTPGADVNVSASWRVTAGSPDIVLAIADTGIDPGHPEFAGRLPDGTSRLLPGVNVADGGEDVRDLYGHGTPVAGIFAARTHDGAHFDSLGIAGICGGDGGTWAGCRLLPIKITSGAAGVSGSFWIAQAVLHAMRAGARAINLSFAGSTPSALERIVLHEAVARGCVVVAASGNRGFRDGTAPQYPAAYAADGLCIQVGASDPYDRRARFSSYGPGLDLVAPGEGVWTTFMTYPSAAGGSHRGYVSAAGTSFAAPFATGAVGLLASLRPELTDTDFQNLLRSSAKDIGDAGDDERTGAGRLDLAAALERVRPEVGIWHDEVAATSFREIRADTLRVIEAGLGGFDRDWLVRPAVLVEATATVAVPDSFADSIQVWPRVAGTTTVRGDFELPYVVPWAEVQSIEPGRFTLRGCLYRATVATTDSSEDSAPDRGDYLPLPADQTRFGFTVIGRVRRPRAGPAAAGTTAPRAWPNPFIESVRIAGLATAGAVVVDVAGRRVRRLDAGSDGTAVWDGRDDHGRNLPSGLYWLSPAPARAGAVHDSPVRVLKLR